MDMAMKKMTCPSCGREVKLDEMLTSGTCTGCGVVYSLGGAAPIEESRERIEIPTEEGGVFRIGYATDIGYVSREVEAGLLGCEAVVLESNHDPDMLRDGPYPYDLKLRISSRRGHLSNPDSAAFAARLCASGTKYLMLAHLSQENNPPDTAYDECVSAVGDEGVRICVAQPDAITELMGGKML
jgi:phosphoribosyl 1,2-cyclic phosphodiesterase